MASRLQKILGPKGVAVCDGAMGSLLYSRGVFINRSFDELNLSRPDLIRQIHEEYLAAGADVIETNTFGANRFKLAPHGLEGLVAQINQQGARIAREAVEAHAGGQRVAGAMGPLGVRIEPWGAVSIEEARAAFREQAEALLAGGVDLIILETFYHLPELKQAVLAVRDVSREVPLVAQVTVTEEARTPEGIDMADFARTASEWDVDAVGINCGVGPVATLEALESMRGATELPLSAMPNAGTPRSIHGRNIYLSSPDYLASYARRFVKAGVRLVGGCCGTEPSHIKAIKDAVVALRPEGPRPALTDAEVARAAARPVPQAEKSGLGRKLAEGRFALAVQLVPPRGWDARETLERARTLQQAGVDLVVIPEARGGAVLPPFAAAQLLLRELGLEAVVEFACRRRTLLRMQSELLGAHALGLRNLLAVTGPPLSMGEHPDALRDLEVDSIGLTNMASRLNQGLDVGGNRLGAPTAFLTGVYLDPFAMDPEHEVRRYQWKVEAGAEFAVTPPVLDPVAFQTFLARIAHCRIPLMATVPPLLSYRAAERLRRETGPGGVPADVLERLREAEREGREAEVGAAIVREVVRAVRPLVQGLQILMPEGQLAAALELAEELRAL